jgi:predicted transcriptional regulator
MKAKALRPVHAACPRCFGKGRIPIYLGADLRAIREASGLSLRELARRLSLSAAYLGDVELGQRRATDSIVNAYKALQGSSSLRQ